MQSGSALKPKADGSGRWGDWMSLGRKSKPTLLMSWPSFQNARGEPCSEARMEFLRASLVERYLLNNGNITEIYSILSKCPKVTEVSWSSCLELPVLHSNPLCPSFIPRFAGPVRFANRMKARFAIVPANLRCRQRSSAHLRSASHVTRWIVKGRRAPPA